MTEATFSSSFTRATRAGRAFDSPTGALVPPIVASTAFARSEIGADGGYAYSRVANPTVSALEAALGELEDAPPAVCFANGLAAETTLCLALLEAGSHVVLSEVVYGGTTRLLRQILGRVGVASTFADTADPQQVAAAIRPQTRLVLVETPANPTFRLTDIAAIARIARDRGVLLAVDNTFLTPLIQRPLDLGADLAVQSTTKFVEGHGTALGGAIASRDEALLERLRFVRKAIGSIQAPFDAFLVGRGLQTLALRLERQSANALAVAHALERQPLVERVQYPGLASFPQAELARRQHGAWHGGALAFELAGGLAAARAFAAALRLCTLAEHVGAVATLVTHPATMTHADVPREQRLAAGIGDGLVRVSVGIEDPAAIIADLDQALGAAAGAVTGAAASAIKGAVVGAVAEEVAHAR